MNTKSFLSFLFFFLFILTAKAQDLLPDLVTSPFRLYTAKIDIITQPGHTLLRFTNSTPNLGKGPLELRGGEIIGYEQIVYQRIYKRDKTYWDRLAGTFIYHSTHEHVHFADFAQYRLREMTEEGGLGNIVVEAEKTSFCARDSSIAFPFKRGFKIKSKYTSCDGGVQGISVGWTDIYHRNLADQWVDITNLPSGSYYLESEVNPDRTILEKSYKNNIARISICIEDASQFYYGPCQSY